MICYRTRLEVGLLAEGLDRIKPKTKWKEPQKSTIAFLSSLFFSFYLEERRGTVTTII